MLEIKDVCFRYKRGNFKVDRLSLSVEPVYIYCLLGENGSGKTTFMKLMYGMLTGDSGSISWNGHDILSGGRIKHKELVKYHAEASFTGEEWCALNMSLGENVKMLSTLYPTFDREYFDKLIARAGLKSELDKSDGKLSKGQKVKAEIAFNLAKRPKLMILDEPLANLDPVFKMEILEILQDAVAENNMSLIISTHLIDEVTDMVDYIILMKKGEIVKAGDRYEVLEKEGKTELRELFSK